MAAGAVPKLTLEAPDSPVPLIQTAVPPVVGPLEGLIAVTTGTAGVTKLKWSAALTTLVATGVVTVMSTVVPFVPAGDVTDSWLSVKA